MNVFPVEPNWNSVEPSTGSGILDARHAVEGVALLLVVEDADPHTGDPEFLGQLADLGLKLLVDVRIIRSAGSPQGSVAPF